MAEDKKRKDEGVVIPKEKRQPNAPEYLHMSKKDVVEAERKRLEKAAKVAAYEKSLDAAPGDPGVKVPTAPDVKNKGKKGKEKSQRPGEKVK